MFRVRTHEGPVSSRNYKWKSGAFREHVRHLNSQRGGQIVLVFLFLGNDLAELVGQGVVADRFGLLHPLAVVLDGFSLVIQVETEHLFGLVAQLYRLGRGRGLAGGWPLSRKALFPSKGAQVPRTWDRGSLKPQPSLSFRPPKTQKPGPKVPRASRIPQFTPPSNHRFARLRFAATATGDDRRLLTRLMSTPAASCSGESSCFSWRP